MSLQSALFGPSKYGLLPELLPEKRLSWGNGILELGTFLAAIGGMVGAGLLFAKFSTKPVWSGVVLFGLTVIGLFTSFGITRVAAGNPAKKFRVNFLADLWGQVKLIRKDRVLFLAAVGNTFFFAIAVLIQLLILNYAADVLHIPKTDSMSTTYLLAALSVGIGVGSVAAGYLSGGKIEYGLIPLGAVGLTVFAALLGRSGLSFVHVAVDLSFLGFFGGFFIVPIAALLQHRPSKEERGGVLAAANLLSWTGILAAAGINQVLTGSFNLSPSAVFSIIAAATLAGTVYVLWLLPDALLRFALWLLTRTIYRIRVLGRDNIPDKGGALFVCNHVSFVDALLLIASTDRHVRFMMYTEFYDRPYLKPFARILGVIPIPSEQRPREMVQALETASQAIRDGHVVCLFAEGHITRIGQLLPFRRGIERIMKNVEAPIVPVALDGVWGSIFSFEKKRFLWKRPRHIPYPVTVSFGKSLPATATAPVVRTAVQELLSAAWPERRRHMRPVHRAFVRTARRTPSRFAMADSQSPKASFGSALVKTVFLARRLKKVWAGQKMVGLLLPPSVPGALVNFAAMLLGKVPVNLNYTVSESTLASCVEQCGITTVITSRKFIEK
ncbi:MAG TPA: MFS transporter, partial [Verrucomicrobiae bacterium]|nr:MFS transporter [Verrucomicrobiae bacterium]